MEAFARRFMSLQRSNEYPLNLTVTDQERVTKVQSFCKRSKHYHSTEQLLSTIIDRVEFQLETLQREREIFLLEQICGLRSSPDHSHPSIIDLFWWYSYYSSNQKETTNQRSSRFSSREWSQSSPQKSIELFIVILFRTRLKRSQCMVPSLYRISIKPFLQPLSILPKVCPEIHFTHQRISFRWIRLARQSSGEHDLSQWGSTTQCFNWTTAQHESPQWTILLQSDRRSFIWLSASLSKWCVFGVETTETRRTLLQECRDVLNALILKRKRAIPIRWSVLVEWMVLKHWWTLFNDGIWANYNDISSMSSQRIVTTIRMTWSPFLNIR